MTRADLVIVANRLPVDRIEGPDGEPAWRRSPGGLVTAVEQVMQGMDGAWVGWGGQPDLDLEPFVFDDTLLVPVSLSREDLRDYYEGFSNGTIWPLYHDVIATPEFKRSWWDAYVRVNRRFAEAAAAHAADGGFVWVHDYQLQLVPQMLRELRPDVTIGYFHHIPFPAYALFAQLPWRRQVLDGLLGADVIGFQRVADAGNFQRSIRRLLRYPTKGDTVTVPTIDTTPRTVISKAYPISIDADQFLELARRPDVIARAARLREQIGSEKIMLGVDRLDYTKGIRHRLKAYGELLADGLITGEHVTLIQVASPRDRASRRTRICATRSRSPSGASTATIRPSRRPRSGTCTRGSRARRWWRCISPPT